MSFNSETVDAPTLSAAEQKLLLKTTGTTKGAEREHMIYSLTLGTGLREHEVIALKVGDVVHNGSVRAKIHLTVFKGARKLLVDERAPRRPARQIVHLPKAIRRKLIYFLKWKKRERESVALEAPLFMVSKDSKKAERGAALSTRTLRHHFRRWQQAIGFEQPYGFHALRHTALSNLYRVTKDLRAVQKQARHANVNTTQIYTHLTDDEIARAVEGLPC